MTDEKNAPAKRCRAELWQRRTRLQRWAMVLTALFGLYLLLGFLLVPVVVKQQLITQTRKATGRELAVTAVAFNPLQLALQIDGLSLKEADGEPFAGWESLRVDFELSSLWRRAWTFAEIRLVRPRVQIRRLNAETFNFTSLLPAPAPSLAPASSPAADDEATPVALPPILIQRIDVSAGELVYRDDTHADAPVLNYLPIDLHVDAFSTRADPAAPTRGELTVRGTEGARFHWQGDLRLPPLASSGRIEATGFDLASLSRFAAEALPFHLARGKLDIQAGYRLTVESARGVRVQVSEGAATLGDLALADKKAPATQPIEIARIAVTGVEADTATRTVALAQIAASGGRIAATLAADGQLDLLRLFARPPAPQAPQAPTAAPAPWLATLARLSVDGFRIQFTDAGPTPPVTLALDPLRVTVENFRSDNSEPLQIAVDSGVNNGGTLRISGPVGLAPPHAELAIAAQQIPLADFQPYLARVINIQLHSGIASTVGTLSYPEAGRSAGLRYRGDAGIDDFRTTDNRFNREFLSWKKLAIRNLDFEQTANRIAIDSVEFAKLYGRLAIREDGTTNVAKLLVNAPAKDAPPPPKPPAAVPERPFAVRIGRVALVDSAAYFADLTLTPDFRVGIFNLRGAVTDIDSAAGKPIAVTLDGQVDRYAPVTIAGQVNPFLASPALDLKLAFKNLDMTTFTPYSGVYAGHRIKRGQLSVDLHYRLADDQIQGDNHIVMDQMELGEPVRSPKAVDLPLRLALALLKDSKGVIDLGLEVKGNVREPSFSVGGLVWKAVKNLIVKAVSAPFNLIAGLVSGGDSGGALDTVLFAAGSEQLEAPEKSKLDKLAKGLAARPQLRLAVNGNAQPEEDGQALAQHQLDRRLAGLLDSGGAEGAALWPGLGAASADTGFRKKLYALYQDATKERVSDRKAIIEKALREGDRHPSDAEIDAALLQHIEHELLAREDVADRDLAALAQQRAQAVKAYLADSGGVAAERVFLAVGQPDGPPVRGVRLTLDAQ